MEKAPHSRSKTYGHAMIYRWFVRKQALALCAKLSEILTPFGDVGRRGTTPSPYEGRITRVNNTLTRFIATLYGHHAVRLNRYSARMSGEV